MCLNADGDGGNDDKANDHGTLNVIGNKGYSEAPQRCVYGGDHAFHNYCRKAIESGESIDNLLERRKLGHHVQEEGDQSYFHQLESSQGRRDATDVSALKYKAVITP